MTTITPTQSNVQAAMRSFLLGIGLAAAPGTSIEVVQGQDNRVPEPPGPDFVVMTPIRGERLSTNVDTYADASFSAFIAGASMTVTLVGFGMISPGATVYGAAAGTTVVSQTSGPTGGAGVYVVAPPQVTGLLNLFAGQAAILEPWMETVQLDVHGPNSTDNARVISCLMRDQYALDAFAASGFDVVPLHAADPRQVPFTNAEDQYEYRWVIDAALQANRVVSGIGQQFAGALAVTLKQVEATYGTRGDFSVDFNADFSR